MFTNIPQAPVGEAEWVLHRPSPMVERMVKDAERLEGQIMGAVDQVTDCMTDAELARFEAAQEQELIDRQVADAIVEAEEQARAGVGPLAGIAKTSKAYSAALESLRYRLLGNELADDVASLRAAQSKLMDAQVSLERARTRFAALRAVMELKAAALRALA